MENENDLKRENERLVRRVNELETKLRELESDHKEAKEMVEFLTVERIVLCETLKETEEMLENERKQRSEEQKLLSVKEDLLQKMIAKYKRNRQVWEENETIANLEIKKLDEIIDRVIITLQQNQQVFDQCAPLKKLLHDLTQESSSKS